MRSDFELDSNSWDLVITDDIGIVENAAMTSQDSKFSLQLIQGEVFDDNRIGMPWLTDMVSQQVSIAAKKQIIRDVIMSTPGAMELTSLDVAVDNQTGIASCTFEGVTDNGGIFGSSIGDVDIHSVNDGGIIAEYDYITGKSFGLRLERASEATYIKDGLLKYAGINIPRFEDSGLLTEGESINFIRYSDDFSNSAWGTARAIKSPSMPSPDNGNGAIKIIPTTENNTHIIEQSTTSITGGCSYVLSVFAKPGEYKIVRLRAADSTGFLGDVVVDLSTGSFVAGSKLFYIEKLTGQWFRISIPVTTNQLATLLKLSVWVYDNSGNSTFSGDGVSGLFVFGGQIEQASEPTSFIKTNESSLTRKGDILSLINSSGKWLYREYIPSGQLSTVKELVEYDGAVSPYGHLQKLKVWNREPTASERAALGL